MLFGFQYCTLKKKRVSKTILCLHNSEVLKVAAPLAARSLQLALTVPSVHHYIQVFLSWKWLNKNKTSGGKTPSQNIRSIFNKLHNQYTKTNA